MEAGPSSQPFPLDVSPAPHSPSTMVVRPAKPFLEATGSQEHALSPRDYFLKEMYKLFWFSIFVIK